MKKVFVFVLLLLPCLPIVSLDLGVGVDATVWVASEKEDSFKATNTYVELLPALVLMVSPRMEVRPFAIFRSSKQSDPDDIASWDADRSQLDLGLGAGLYYHFIQREIISLSTGPKVRMVSFLKHSGSSAPDFDSRFHFEAQVELPVNLDIRLGKRLYFRVALEISGIYFNTFNYELAGVKYSETEFWIYPFYKNTFDEISVYSGFYLMF